MTFWCPDDRSRLLSGQPDNVIGCDFPVRHKGTGQSHFLPSFQKCWTPLIMMVKSLMPWSCFKTIPNLRGANVVRMPRNVARRTLTVSIPPSSAGHFRWSAGLWYLPGSYVSCSNVEMSCTRYPFIEPPFFRKKEDATKTSWNICCSLLVRLCHVYDFSCFFMILLNVCELSSTLEGRPNFALAERATLRSQVWSHCQFHRIIVSRPHFFMV